MIWDTQPEAAGAGSSWKRVSSLVGGAHKEIYETPKSLSTLLWRETDVYRKPTMYKPLFFYIPDIKDFLLVGVCTESDTPHCLYRLFSLYWCFWYIVLLNDCTDLRSKKRTHWSVPPEILCLLFGTYTYWFYWLWEKRLKRCCYWDILFTGLLHTIKRNFVA